MTALERRAAYEAAVRDLGGIAEKRLAQGADEEIVARELLDLRNKLKARYRQYDNRAVVRLMELRNQKNMAIRSAPMPIGCFADMAIGRTSSRQPVGLLA